MTHMIISWVGYSISIKFNSKAQIKQLMSHLRVRPLEKPIILQSIIFNHRPQSNYSSEEPSFLKLSQKNSQELMPLNDSSLFAQMQNTLNNLEAQSMRKISQIRRQMEKYQCPQVHFSKTDLKLQKKQLDSVACRKLQSPYAEQQFEHFNFEMDQNLNYVCGKQNQIGCNLVKRLIQSKGVVSEETDNFKQILKDSKKSTNRWKDVYYSRRETSLNNKKTDRKRRVSSSSCRQSVTNSARLYEQILSNYSTSKLLAMQRKGK